MTPLQTAFAWAVLVAVFAALATMAVLLFGPVLVCGLFSREMRKRQWGARIVPTEGRTP